MVRLKEVVGARWQQLVQLEEVQEVAGMPLLALLEVPLAREGCHLVERLESAQPGQALEQREAARGVQAKRQKQQEPAHQGAEREMPRFEQLGVAQEAYQGWH